MRTVILSLLILIVLLPAWGSADPFGGQILSNNITIPASTSTGTTCSYTPPLDANAGTLAYSFRLLRTAYSGGNVVTIRRSSDSTTKTFALTIPNCTINQSDAFFDGSTYTIVTWFDQSGSAKDVTATNAPTITLNCQNSQPCVNFVTASSQYLSANTGLSITNNTQADVVDFTSLAASAFVSYQGDGNGSNLTGTFFSLSATAIKARRDAAAVTRDGTSSTATVNTWYRTVGTFNTTLSRIFLNGTQGTDETTSQAVVSGGWVCIGCSAPLSVPATFLSGKVGEVIIFSPDLSSTNSNTVSSNQASFWGIP